MWLPHSWAAIPRHVDAAADDHEAVAGFSEQTADLPILRHKIVRPAQPGRDPAHFFDCLANGEA